MFKALMEKADKEDDMGVAFFCHSFLKDGKPFDFFRWDAFGSKEKLICRMTDSFAHDRDAYHVITKAWIRHYMLTYSHDCPDLMKRDLRVMLIRVFGDENARKLVRPSDDATVIIRNLEVVYPDRQKRAEEFTNRVKQYRSKGLKDIAALLHQEATRLKASVAEEEQKATDMRNDANRRIQMANEAARVRQLRKQEAIELQRLEHDYDSMGRRVRNYRAMIDRLTAEMEALQQEQRDLQQRNPQFDPHSAAKKKRQQLAERKRERAAHKKKGKESLPDTTRSCSPMLSKKGA